MTELFTDEPEHIDLAVVRARIAAMEQARREAARHTAEPERPRARRRSRATGRGVRPGGLSEEHRRAVSEARRKNEANKIDRASASRLTRARVDRQLTVSAAAALVNIGPTTFRAAETQPQLVSRRTLAKIAAEFGPIT